MAIVDGKSILQNITIRRDEHGGIEELDHSCKRKSWARQQVESQTTNLVYKNTNQTKLHVQRFSSATHLVLIRIVRIFSKFILSRPRSAAGGGLASLRLHKVLEHATARCKIPESLERGEGISERRKERNNKGKVNL